MIIKHAILMTIIYELTGRYTCCLIPILQCKKYKLTKAVHLCFFVYSAGGVNVRFSNSASNMNKAFESLVIRFNF